MGVVFEAEQLSLGRKVALKVMPFAAMLDKRQLARFHNEARAAATLNHAHIVPVHAVGEERGVHYYAMQFIAGQSLAQIIGQMRGQSANPPASLMDAVSRSGETGESIRDRCESLDSDGQRGVTTVNRADIYRARRRPRDFLPQCRPPRYPNRASLGSRARPRRTAS